MRRSIKMLSCQIFSELSRCRSKFFVRERTGLPFLFDKRYGVFGVLGTTGVSKLSNSSFLRGQKVDIGWKSVSTTCRFRHGSRSSWSSPLLFSSSLYCDKSIGSEYGVSTNVLGSRQRPRFLSSLSPRQRADLEHALSSVVGGTVKDPILKKSLSSLGWFESRCITISNDGETVHLQLRLPTLLHPQLDQLKRLVSSEATQALLRWKIDNHIPNNNLLSQVSVQAIAVSPVPFMARIAEDPQDIIGQLGPGLQNVAHFLAVYSCKGGVGKSTVAVNLAYELARLGGRVGLLDLDLYGPSLPLLVHPNDTTVRRSTEKGSGMVYPIEHEGVRLLSLGFVNPDSGVQGSGMENGAAILRGPLAVKVVAQLLKGTDWGELDLLILDLPPGTGDVQLAVCQDLALTGAVAVTTPSKLAIVDTRKGMEMFQSLGVPTVAVVENMAFFVCQEGKIHHPFGPGFSNDPIGSKSISTIQLPISLAANDAAESGQPLCLMRPATAQRELDSFETLAHIVSRELLRIQYGDTDLHQIFVSFPQENGSDHVFNIDTLVLSLPTILPANFKVRLFSEAGAAEKRIQPVELRARDPRTGELIEDSPFRNQLGQNNDPIVTIHKTENAEKRGKISPSITPVKVERKGRYGFGVQWADGATIIYSKLCIAKATGGKIQENNEDKVVDG